MIVVSNEPRTVPNIRHYDYQAARLYTLVRKKRSTDSAETI